MSIAERRAVLRGYPALLTQGFRPFFLAAGLWAAIALIVWIAMLNTGVALPSRFDPLSWHIHEMLFGFVMAAIAGFLLTAIPNWTGRLPVSGGPLSVLTGLWLVGRLACLVSLPLPVWLAVAADMAFPVALVLVVARELIAAGNRPNMPMVLPVAVLGIANLLMHLEVSGFGVPAGLGWRLAVAAILVLVSVVGGRIIPSFTRNWLVARHIEQLPSARGVADRIALGSLHAGLFGWAFFPVFRPIGFVLVVAAVLNLLRLSRWQGARTAAEPLLLILHIGYAWLCVGAGLLGLSMLSDDIPQTAGIHAITVGAIGTMILAVMTRATRGHTGRPLAADRSTTILYGCATAAALIRIAAEFATDWAMPLILVAASFWVAAFGLFVVRYGAMLLRPRHGV